MDYEVINDLCLSKYLNIIKFNFILSLQHCLQQSREARSLEVSLHEESRVENQQLSLYIFILTLSTPASSKNRERSVLGRLGFSPILTLGKILR
jgi:hypothetical protein